MNFYYHDMLHDSRQKIYYVNISGTLYQSETHVIYTILIQCTLLNEWVWMKNRVPAVYKWGCISNTHRISDQKIFLKYLNTHKTVCDFKNNS